MTLPEKDMFGKLVDGMTPPKSAGVTGSNQDNEAPKETTPKKKPRQQLPQQQDRQQQPPQQQEQQQQLPPKKAPDSSLLSTDMLIVKSPPDEKGAAPVAGEARGGGAWAAAAARWRACWRGPGTRAALVALGGLHVSLGLLMAAAGALGAARGAAVAAAGAALWGGGAAGAAGAAALWAGLRGRGRGRGRGAAAHLALALCALALSNLVAVLAAVGLARDAARARDLPDPKVSGAADASPLNAGLLAVSALHVAVCVVSAARTYRLACPCARGSGASSRSDGSRGSSWGSSAASGRRRLVSSWLGQQARPPAAAAAPHVVLVAPPLPPPPLGQPILAPLYAVQTPSTKFPAASVINVHIPASLPYMNPMPKHRHGHPRPQSLPYSQSLARPKRKRIAEDQRRHHTLEGRHSKSVPVKTQPKKKRQITEEEVEKTYTGLDRNLAEEFISIAMEPGVGKERLARSASDGVSSGSQPPASI